MKPRSYKSKTIIDKMGQVEENALVRVTSFNADPQTQNSGDLLGHFSLTTQKLESELQTFFLFKYPSLKPLGKNRQPWFENNLPIILQSKAFFSIEKQNHSLTT